MALNTVSLKTSLNSYMQTFSNRRETNADTLNFHNEMVLKTDGVVDTVATAEQIILANRTLSDEGKSTALAQLATGAASKFAFLERVVSRVDQERRDLRATLDRVTPPAAAGTDPVLQFLYAQEIRHDYKGMPQNKTDAAFITATQGGREETDAIVWAISQSPTQMITPEIRDRALDERGRRLRPAVFAQWQQANLLFESLNGLLDSVRGWLRGLGGDPKKIHDELGGPEPEPSRMQAGQMVAA